MSKSFTVSPPLAAKRDFIESVECINLAVFCLGSVKEFKNLLLWGTPGSRLRVEFEILQRLNEVKK